MNYNMPSHSYYFSYLPRLAEWPGLQAVLTSILQTQKHSVVIITMIKVYILPIS